MTLDVEMHSSVIAVGITEQARGGFTVTSDRDTAFGGYMAGFCQIRVASLDKGQRFHTYWYYATVGKRTIRFYTFPYGTTPPDTEPTDRSPEHEFYVETVSSTVKTVTFKDKDSGAEVECFVSFVKKDNPHLYNTVTKGSGETRLSTTATVPASPADWMMEIEKRIDDKTVYYELIDPTTIPDGTSTILMPKRTEAVGRCRIEINFEGLKGILERLYLYSDPFYWGLLIAGVISPEHAAWILNNFFTMPFSGYLSGEIVGVHTTVIAPNVFDVDFRITPNTLKFWSSFARALAKALARVIPFIALLIPIYFIIHEFRLMVTTPAEIVKSLNEMITDVTNQSHDIQAKILADPTLTAEQKTKAIENEKTFTSNTIRTATQTASDISKAIPTPWTTYLLIGGVILAVVVVLYMVLRGVFK